MALYWIWSCRLQIKRLGNSTLAEWDSSYKTAIERRRVFSATSYDQHLVLVAGRNLLKSLEIVERHFPELSLEIREGALIKHLRNMHEHWEDHQASSLGIEIPASRAKQTINTQKEVERLGAKAWSIRYGPEGPVLGDVIILRDFIQRLEELEYSLLRQESKLER
jgi:hypothetical protein